MGNLHTPYSRSLPVGNLHHNRCRLCPWLQPKGIPDPIPSIPGRLPMMIITLETPAEHALICRTIAGIRRILGRSLPIQIQTADGRLVNADDLQALLQAAADQRVSIRRHAAVVQRADHGGQVQQLGGQAVEVVGLQTSHHGLQAGNPCRVS